MDPFTANMKPTEDTCDDQLLGQCSLPVLKRQWVSVLCRLPYLVSWWPLLAMLTVWIFPYSHIHSFQQIFCFLIPGNNILSKSKPLLLLSPTLYLSSLYFSQGTEFLSLPLKYLVPSSFLIFPLKHLLFVVYDTFWPEYCYILFQLCFIKISGTAEI